MELAAWFDAIRSSVTARLEVRLGALAARAEALAPSAGPWVDAAAALTLRSGKRLRPALVWTGFEAISDQAPAIDGALEAVELLQTHLLIQDDWMDGDLVRRGGPSVHAALRARCGDSHLGDSLAILVSDLLLAEAHRALAETEAPAAAQRAASAAFSQMIEEVVLGQYLDLIADPDVERIHRLKTASYTVAGPLAIGAALAGASAEQRAALRAFAEPAGIAFQLRDDVLGTFGDAEATGKPLGDLGAGKRTALVARALALGLETALFERVLLRRADPAELTRAKALLEAPAVLGFVEAELARRVSSAEQALAAAPIRPAARERLSFLLRRLTERSH